jgi:hypothetical protein
MAWPRFVHEHVTQVVDVEIAIEPNLPASEGIEADQRLGNAPKARTGTPLIVLDVSEGKARRLRLRPDEDIRDRWIGPRE